MRSTKAPGMRRLLKLLSSRKSGFLVISRDGRALLERYFLVEKPKFGIYLHRCVGADLEPGVYHDHPWAWSFSIVLAGYYTEERPTFGEPLLCRIMRPLRINVLGRNTFHRLPEIAAEGAWTVYVRGPRVKADGFLVADGGNVWHYEPADASGRESKVALPSAPSS